MRDHGFTLIELLIAIAIMGILMAIATLNWHEMQLKSAVESEIKKIHADLTEIRLQALYSKTARRVILSGQQFKIYSSAETSVDPIVTKQLRYPIVSNGGDPLILTFNSQGVTSDICSICVLPTNDLAVLNSAAEDSIIVSQTRLNLGKRTGGVCDSDHIDQK
ncbi:MAG: type II secretion system protein [Desulfuromonadaceae bacterium]|nr:type II secretion system protein [Desulfuromonadaceae bacterium]